MARRRRRPRRWVYVVVLAIPVAITALAFAAATSGKSYRFSRVAIDATVLPDGSLRLREQRTFDFDGDFSFAFFTVAWPFDRIQDFRIEEAGRPLEAEIENVGTFRATWRFGAEDERRTFTISYRALCAVRVGEDAAHLLWQFVGTGWDVPTEETVIRVHLPGAATRRLDRRPTCELAAPAGGGFPTRPLRRGEVRAWGHGPLGGEVRIPDPQTVELRVRDLPPYTFVEGSVLFPPRAVPLAAPSFDVSRSAVLAEERELARQANAERARLLAEERRRAFWTRVGVALALAIPLAMLVLLVVARMRDRVPGVPRLLQQPPEEIHPVELARLWGFYRGNPRPQDVYRAQLLHLARMRVIEMRALGAPMDPDDIEVRLIELPSDDGFDVAFAEFLFASGGEWVALGDLRPTGKRRTELRQWWKDVTATGKAQALRIRQGRWESRLVTLLGTGGVVAAIALGNLIGPLALAVGFGAPIAMAITNILIPGRAPEPVRERIARWRAFRRFLRRFSSLPDAPALGVVIWEHYLAYAAALGVADEVEEQVRAVVPADDLPAPWRGAPAGAHGLSWVGSVGSATTPSVAAAAVSSSTSSGIGSFSSGGGFGGGFSGGGGGGGGGTGGGAG
ncbi:MAG TPA: DUF2207 domain-containing protein [Actinomycetota bacterium]|nr:DUF2207 domain-containing protein [Actinomycetota bacterium]